MIRGYPNPPSVLQGETVRLHIASDAPLHFQIWFYRQGQTLVLKARTETMVADALPLRVLGPRLELADLRIPDPARLESGPISRALFLSSKRHSCSSRSRSSGGCGLVRCQESCGQR